MDSCELARELAQKSAGNWLRWSSCFMDSPGEFEEDWFFFGTTRAADKDGSEQHHAAIEDAYLTILGSLLSV